MMGPKDTHRFAAVLQSLFETLRGSQLTKTRADSYWKTLKSRCTIEELEQAAEKACLELVWQPTPRELLDIIHASRPRKFYRAKHSADRLEFTSELRNLLLNALEQLDGEES